MARTGTILLAVCALMYLFAVSRADSKTCNQDVLHCTEVLTTPHGGIGLLMCRIFAKAKSLCDCDIWRPGNCSDGKVTDYHRRLIDEDPRRLCWDLDIVESCSRGKGTLCKEEQYSKVRVLYDDFMDYVGTCVEIQDIFKVQKKSSGDTAAATPSLVVIVAAISTKYVPF